MSNSMSSPSSPHLVTVRGLAEMPQYTGAFSEASLRALIFNSTPRQNSKGEPIPSNGLAEAGVIIRVGRKVLIDVKAFESWLLSQRTCN